MGRVLTVTPLPTCTSGIALTYPTGSGDSAKLISCCKASGSTSIRLAYRYTCRGSPLDFRVSLALAQLEMLGEWH